MKILAFTDNHGDPEDLKAVKKKVKNADIIICGGDITIFEHEIEYNMQKINDFGKEVLIIHGNHESDFVIRELSKYFKNIRFMHKKHYEKDGHLFFGYGGGGFAISDKEFEKKSKSIEKLMKEKKTILILHGPPYKTKLDNIGGAHVGNKSFTNFIKKTQPELVICGHIHECFHRKDKIGKTRIINPGPDGEIIEI
ncbi:MAG: metallophosphoesterase [Nanoarchaeota archaeon]|nr:metallophosphoesterase family protein [Nanoarchaeota archaeon]MBU1030867.1 metallophosphoesterase family protein [Nanoarchaeota archaeon]MBU1850729.1 metallophosphoesterase family protein [Nanoarchaeota archaeon]